MARTIRRTEMHLLKWWLPELKALTQSEHPWRQHRLPGLLYSRQEPRIVRAVQSDRHRFFCGPEKFNRRRYQKLFKQSWQRELRRVIRSDDWDTYMDPEIYYPYML